jgi:hypothetical protein
MVLTWLLFGVLLVVPGVWMLLMMIGYIRSSELRAAVDALETTLDEAPR